MTTEFLSITLPRPATIANLQAEVIAALQQYGQPLRWSITRIEANLIYIEAIVSHSPVESAW
jgi:hypothetical protein